MTALPEPIRNADSQELWDGMQQEKLLLQECGDCGALDFMPRHMCPVCWSPNRKWREASGEGTVHSFSIVRRASSPAFAPRTPYVVALVDLAEGPRMPTALIGDDALSVAIGDPVTMTFEERGDQKLAVFQLTK
ncbi:MAG: hypothetical protein CVU23_00235 [Betaproteobacteria bacterium HGW-Betaproteobacteria-17]|nr:MAG: hypothetical protein CVU23_00235 [Betaproteobacteria bacterium HGW-Betaproteobacteria-17]